MSINAVAIIVKLPPSSTLRAAPKKRFGRCNALASTFDEPAARHVQVAEMVIERAKRVIESNKIMTSFLCSTKRFARSITISAT